MLEISFREVEREDPVKSDGKFSFPILKKHALIFLLNNFLFFLQMLKSKNGFYHFLLLSFGLLSLSLLAKKNRWQIYQT